MSLSTLPSVQSDWLRFGGEQHHLLSWPSGQGARYWWAGKAERSS